MKNKAMVEVGQKCDVCQQSLKSGITFYDSSTANGWAWLCRLCFSVHGRGLGTGIGQEYDSKTNEKLRG